MLTRIDLGPSDQWDDATQADLLEQYGVDPQTIISVVHDNGQIFLYYLA